MKGYLAGAINGMSDAEANGWRGEAKALMPEVEWLDPMRRDYRGREAENVEDIVRGDLADIAACDVLLVYAVRPSWGTAMEVVYAHQMGKHIVVVCERPSPWLLYHSTITVRSLADAASHISEHGGRVP